MRNNLINETSPYLLQHAENPVNWYPWDEEAFHKAKEENKPIFLSIGYSTCHWCHVMAHESFENNETAKILNKHFISIKVDREERPDIDSVYMSVCQAFTGSGGWPMSVFMTWDKKPFFVGTYFPSRARYGMPSFLQVLNTIANQWISNKKELLKSAEEIIRHLKNESATDNRQFDSGLIQRAVQWFEKSFDSTYGGFGNEPKFPTPHNLLFLMLYAKQNNDSNALSMVEKTLIQMRKGGIFDHIGYGFSRYYTDKYYLAPHFEKMLYDNSLLIITYASAYIITGNNIYLDTAEKIAEYILKEMTSECGGFYLSDKMSSELFINPKETYDGAIPSGNSVMTYNLVRLYGITEKSEYKELVEKQVNFMSSKAYEYPGGNSMFLIAMLLGEDYVPHIRIALKEHSDLNKIIRELPFLANVEVVAENIKYPLLNNQTTFYVCKNGSCLPPTNEIEKV